MFGDFFGDLAAVPVGGADALGDMDNVGTVRKPCLGDIATACGGPGVRAPWAEGFTAAGTFATGTAPRGGAETDLVGSGFAAGAVIT